MSFIIYTVFLLAELKKICLANCFLVLEMSIQSKFTGESLAAFWIKKYLFLFKLYCLSSEDPGLIAFSLLLPCLYFAHGNASQVLGAFQGDVLCSWNS